MKVWATIECSCVVSDGIQPTFSVTRRRKPSFAQLEGGSCSCVPFHYGGCRGPANLLGRTALPKSLPSGGCSTPSPARSAFYLLWSLAASRSPWAEMIDEMKLGGPRTARLRRTRGARLLKSCPTVRILLFAMRSNILPAVCGRGPGPPSVSSLCRSVWGGGAHVRGWHCGRRPAAGCTVRTTGERHETGHGCGGRGDRRSIFVGQRLRGGRNPAPAWK